MYESIAKFLNENLVVAGSIIVLTVGAAIGFLLIWMMMFSINQQKILRSDKTFENFIKDKVNSIVYSASTGSMNIELAQLRDYMGQNTSSYDVFSEAFFEILNSEEAQNEASQKNLFHLLDSIEPIKFYSRMLKRGTAFEKAHACRMLANYAAEDQIKEIEKLLSSKNQELSYSAAMALSKLGDEESVSRFVIGCKDNFRLSRRLVLQLLGEYNDDIKSLANLVFRECDEHTKATVIKSIAKYNFIEFEDIYLESLKSKNATLRVAAILALGNFCDPKYEAYITKAFVDRVWIVRNAAIKALGMINTETAVDIVARATSDPEWWVRYNAAKTLIAMNGGLEAIESILQKYDTYASDAIKYALYRDYSRTETA